VLVTVRYEKRASCEEEETIVGIRETEGESGDMGAWLYPVSKRVHRNCGVDGYIPASVCQLDYLCKELKYSCLVMIYTVIYCILYLKI
jgi:hypothetical protein